MRKAIFNNRFGDTITTDEILAPVHICGQLSCAIDEDVDNSDDIEAICGEEVAEQYREALDEGDCDKARDIIDTTVFTMVEAMTSTSRSRFTRRSPTRPSPSTTSKTMTPRRNVRAPESPNHRPRTDSSRSKQGCQRRNIEKSHGRRHPRQQKRRGHLRFVSFYVAGR